MSFISDSGIWLISSIPVKRTQKVGMGKDKRFPNWALGNVISKKFQKEMFFLKPKVDVAPTLVKLRMDCVFQIFSLHPQLPGSGLRNEVFHFGPKK